MFNAFEITAGDWLKARLAEMDAAVSAVERKTKGLETDLVEQSAEYYEKLKNTRLQMESLAKDTLEKGKDSVPELKKELEPVWQSFGQSLEMWTNLAHAQDEVYEAQLKAQGEIWESFVSRWREAAGDIQDSMRDTVLKQIDEQSRQFSKFQRDAMAGTSTPWSGMNSSLDQARDMVEQAAKNFQDTFFKFK